MKIAVMGSGGIGGYFGGLLAKAGEDVTFIARGAHLEAIQKNGLQVKSVAGDFHVRPKATRDPPAVGPADLVLFCVK
ncbi:MAG: 2-dehydropantoate 2-reductase, partial [candidate division NC10 bacterium]|nr:2-dehydropantoate 2-reductase [candidate division NC10 bacterium]